MKRITSILLVEIFLWINIFGQYTFNVRGSFNRNSEFSTSYELDWKSYGISVDFSAGEIGIDLLYTPELWTSGRFSIIGDLEYGIYFPKSENTYITDLIGLTVSYEILEQLQFVLEPRGIDLICPRRRRYDLLLGLYSEILFFEYSIDVDCNYEYTVGLSFMF